MPRREEPGRAGPPHWRPQSHAGRRREEAASARPSPQQCPAAPHHELPQAVQHLGDRVAGDQVAAERGDTDPGREEHQVRAGGHLPGQRAAGGDAGQGGRPQGHPAPDRQRGPVLRGLRGLRGSGGAEHPAAVPEAGLSPPPARPPLGTTPLLPRGAPEGPGEAPMLRTHPGSAQLLVPR